MPKTTNQKLKLLYLLKILNEKTDENHCLTTQELIDELALYDIRAERKSIYDDIECLNVFGYEVEYIKAKKGGGYYLAERDFELPELKLRENVSRDRYMWWAESRPKTKASIII